VQILISHYLHHQAQKTPKIGATVVSTIFCIVEVHTYILLDAFDTKAFFKK